MMYENFTKSGLDNTVAEKVIPKQEVFLEDLEEAREFIDDLYESGERPVVTLPVEYLDEVLQNGLHARTTWIPDLKVIAGTFGRAPYDSSDRVILKLTGIDRNKINPRMTGPDKAFQGVVTLEGPITPSEFTVEGITIQ